MKLLVHYVYGITISYYFFYNICDAYDVEINPSFGFSLALHGNSQEWVVSNKHRNISVSTTIPITVHEALQQAGIIPDPNSKRNEINYSWVALSSWSFRTNLAIRCSVAKNGWLAKSNIPTITYTRSSTYYLRLTGLDTIADIKFNKRSVRQTENEFQEYVVDLSAELAALCYRSSGPGLHQLARIEVVFKSALQEAQRRYKQYPYNVPSDQFYQNWAEPSRRAFIRKSGAAFGWDWGPAFATMGIVGPVTLLVLPRSTPLLLGFIVQPSLSDVTVSDQLVDPMPIVGAKVLVHTMARQHGTARLRLQSNNDTEVIADIAFVPGLSKSYISITLRNVRLWWPIGHGKQILHNLTVSLIDKTNKPVWTKSHKFGVRHVALVEDDVSDSDGSTFYFRINGAPIFIKGANLVPVDSFVTRVPQKRIDRIIKDVISANMNTIRIWGGGIYQSEGLYQLCDEAGIMIWQEFMFACSLYPAHPSFLQEIKQEAIYQLRRLGNHPSIILWGGNNENEIAMDRLIKEQLPGGIKALINHDIAAGDLTTIFVTALKPLVDEILGNQSAYVDTSPSNGVLSYKPYVKRWGNVSDTARGDIHYYSYDTDCFDTSLIPRPRFVSEFGYQSLPSMETLRSVIESEELYVLSDSLKWRQRSDKGYERMEYQIDLHFQRSNISDSVGKLYDLIYLSQLQQALCYERMTLYWRSLYQEKDSYTGGVLYWQLNDIWQGPSWSSIDYDGRWKMLHYAARNFFAPLALSAKLTRNTLSVTVVNDQRRRFEGVVSLQIWNLMGEQKWSMGHAFAVAEYATVLLPPLHMASVVPEAGCSLSSCFLLLEIDPRESTQSIQPLETNILFLKSPKDLHLPEPQLTLLNAVSIADSNQGAIRFSIATDKVAFYVFFSMPQEPLGRFSRNILTMIPNNTYEIVFVSHEALDITCFAKHLRYSTLSSTTPARPLIKQ